MRGHRLIFANNTNFFVGVEAQHDRAAQSYFFGCVAPDDRILHCEIRVGDLQPWLAIHLDTFLAQVSGEFVTRKCVVGKIIGDTVNEIVLFIQKCEPAWLLFFDRGDLDTPDHRDAFALQPHSDGLFLHIADGWFSIENHFTKIRVRLQHNSRGAFPCCEPVGTGAYRVGHDVVDVFFNDFTRDDG